MYNLIVWDTELAAAGGNGSLKKMSIPLDFARLLFQLPSAGFPILSSLSFDDHDLFSGFQLDSLAGELIEVLNIDPSASSLVDLMVSFIRDAKLQKKSVLFDPFGKE
ncbi:hypothetical protein [Variovorax boronicumulans]|uniref:hypothetical protein n=1 Tax=Variovorax boronicumulans TaxID=436515 RepID=UPI0033957A4F